MVAGSRLVLASASPRRQKLIDLLGRPWRAAPSAIDEQAHLAGEPLVAALSVALAKTRAVGADEGEFVVGADTLVVADSDILAKPGSAAEARDMLRRLRGRAHQVLTGVALATVDRREWGGVVATRVTMREYADAEIEHYIERGEPFDKAGAYAIQDAEFRPVEQLEGCYLNVVGLPLCALASGLASLGETLEVGAAAPPCAYCRAGERLLSPRSGY